MASLLNLVRIVRAQRGTDLASLSDQDLVRRLLQESEEILGPKLEREQRSRLSEIVAAAADSNLELSLPCRGWRPEPALDSLDDAQLERWAIGQAIECIGSRLEADDRAKLAQLMAAAGLASCQ